MPCPARLIPAALALAVLLAPAGPAAADPGDAPASTSGAPGQAAPSREARRDQEMQAALQAADAAAEHGPAEIRLLNQATLALPAGARFIPAEPAKRLHRALGNSGDREILGILVDDLHHLHYFGVLRYSPDGYVRDDEAKDLDPETVLKAIREGTESQNADRRRRGFSEIEPTGWQEPPSYDPSAHRLIWALGMRSKGEADPSAVNYNTRVLGREGYLSLNMLTNQEGLADSKAVAGQFLDQTAFVSGKRYEDFNSATDKVAAVGLIGLLGVVAAKKLGLVALALAFAAKFTKLIVLAGVAALAGLSRLVKRRTA